MSESITITDGTRQVIVCIVGAGSRPWGMGCVNDDCKAIVIGYTTRNQGVRGAEAHLKWHANGKPTCNECGTWLSREASKRCRRGTCEVDR
jgi:hypothetical protein